MKAGDYLYCKQNLPTYLTHHSNKNYYSKPDPTHLLFLSNHKYLIDNIYPAINNDQDFVFEVINESGDISVFNKFEIKLYFYTPQEIRNLKLQQLR